MLSLITVLAILFKPRNELKLEWKELASLNYGHSRHCVVRLSSDTVLVVGGFDSSGKLTRICELYDPVTNSWLDSTTFANLNLPSLRYDGQVLLINPGTPYEAVLYIGGWDKEHEPQNTVFMFNPETKHWTQVTGMNTARSDFAAIRLNNGEILVAGGEIGNNRTTNTAEIYDPVKDRWRYISPMNNARTDEPELVNISDDEVMIVGGSSVLEMKDSRGNSIHLSLNTSEIHNLTTGKWSFTGNTMHEGRRDHLVLAIPDKQGRIYKIMAIGGIVEDSLGGLAETYHFSFSSEICEYNDEKWSWGTYQEFDDPKRARYLPGGRVLNNKEIVIFGGNASEHITLDQVIKRFRSGGMDSAEIEQRVAWYKTQGYELFGGPSNYVDLYNIKSKTWTSKVPQLNKGRWGPALESTPAPVLSDGRILVVGGASETEFAQRSVEALEVKHNPLVIIWKILYSAVLISWITYLYFMFLKK